MASSVESRLWLAVHLLYSNASQAFDVYQAVVMQSDSAIASDDNSAVFIKLIQVFEKIPAISTNLSFYEFEFEEIDQWKIIYKNSQKVQLLIFVGVLIFELKIAEIASHLKLPQEKVQFLFNQIFKKLASASQKLKYNEQLEFKKQNDNKISYLFTYENLVDFCLGQLTNEESEKVKAGLQMYPSLQVAKEEYTRIIRQIQNLKVQKANSISDRQGGKTNRKNKAGLKVVNEKTQGAVAAATASRSKKAINILIASAATITLVVILLQPMALVERLLKKNHSVVIHEVDKHGDINAAKPPSPPASASPTTVASVPPPPPVAESIPAPAVPAPAPAPAPAAVVVSLPTPAKSEGGLYRGTLIVANIEAVNAKIIEKISSLGGVKAGEVELGWLKSAKLAYYHYTIPEKNIEDVTAFMKQMGLLRLNFEKHPRKVAAGTKRFIIEVKQN